MKFLIFILIVYQIQRFNCQTGVEIIEAIQAAEGAIKAVKGLYDLISESTSTTKEKYEPNYFQILSHKLDDVSRKIDELDQEFKKSLKDFASSIADTIKFETKMRPLEDIRDKIDSRFKRLLEMAKHRDALDAESLSALAGEILYGAESIGNLLEQLHTKLFENDNSYITTMFTKIDEKSHETSNSAQVVMHRFYVSLMTNHMKGLVMQLFANKIKKDKLMDRVQSKNKIKRLIDTFYKQTGRVNEEFGDLVKRADRTIWKSDPKKHILHKTYDEITRFNQIYFAMENSFVGDSCAKKCSDYKYETTYKPAENKQEYIPKQRNCNGVVKECQLEANREYYCSGLNIWLPSSGSDRIYDYVEDAYYNHPDYACEKKFGQKEKTEGRSADVDHWSRLKGALHCDLCRCVCEDPSDPETDRYFSLAEVRSNTDQNMVVTGVRFFKQDQIFHLQIQEGILTESGRINMKSRKWKDVPYRSKTDSTNVFRLTDTDRMISISDVQFKGIRSANFVVTGIKLSRSTIGSEKGLKLDVIYTKFDQAVGRLIPDTDETLSVEDNLQIIYLTERDQPTNYQDNTPSSAKGYVYFNRTGVVYDVGQSTVPFIDVQPVESALMPLSAISLQLRVNSKSGGFIAPKLETLPIFVSHTDLPNEISYLQFDDDDVPADKSASNINYLNILLIINVLVLYHVF